MNFRAISTNEIFHPGIEKNSVISSYHHLDALMKF